MIAVKPKLVLVAGDGTTKGCGKKNKVKAASAVLVGLLVGLSIGYIESEWADINIWMPLLAAGIIFLVGGTAQGLRLISPLLLFSLLLFFVFGVGIGSGSQAITVVFLWVCVLGLLLGGLIGFAALFWHRRFKKPLSLGPKRHAPSQISKGIYRRR